MPEINASSIVEVRLGDQKVGALMAGTNEIYVCFEKVSLETPGNFTVTLPDWASAYGVIMSGGGGGGQAGSGADNSNGYGGQGGDVTALWGRMNTSSSKVLSVTIGAGGAGGASPREYGGSGGTTTLITHSSNEYSVAGGTGNPTSGVIQGGTKATVLTDPFHKYCNMPLDTTYRNGPVGTGNGGSGKRGGGGAGGYGGLFANYSKGGKGGDGFVDIYIWGFPRH